LPSIILPSLSLLSLFKLPPYLASKKLKTTLKGYKSGI
jgi:hypothetical protein